MNGQTIINNIISGLITTAVIAIATFSFRKRIVASLFRFQERRLRPSGVAGITQKWADLIRFSGSQGHWLRSRYMQSRSATWYFITHNPHAFYLWLGVLSEEGSILSRVQSNDIDVIWVFHECATHDRESPLFHGPLTEGTAGTYQRGVEALRVAKSTQPDKWKLLSSEVSHFYLAFLSVPREVGSINGRQAPAGTFGIVMPYLMTAGSYAGRFALCLEAPQDRAGQDTHILDQYYNSIRDFVSVGQSRGWLTEDHGSQAAAVP